MQLLLTILRKPFTLDLRGLALLRIGIGALLLIDLYTRATDLEAHYANSGVLPLPALLQHSWNPYFFSFHTGSGLWEVQGLLFLVAAALAFCLMLGFRTQLVSVLSWVFLVSVQNRNPLILQGGDDLLRMLLFWGIFLPWGNFYSLDANRKCSENKNTASFSAATVAFVLQLFILYFCTALLKNSPEWHTHGTAIYFALSLDQILLPLGRFIYPFYDLLKGMTLGVYYTELLLPFLLLVPFYTTFFRLLVIGVLFSLHLGISLTLFVGLFYLINLVSLLGLLPEKALDKLEQKIIVPVARFFRPGLDFLVSRPYPFSFKAELGFTCHPTLKKNLIYGRELLVSLLLVYVLWWNLDTTSRSRLPFPEGLRGPGFLVRLDQHWSMFSPAVFKDDGWYLLEGTTGNNQKIDLNRKGKKLTFRKPAAVVSLFRNDRWRKYSENYLFVDNAWMRPFYCNYLLRRWNEENATEKRVKSLEVVYMKEVSLDLYLTKPIKREVLCICEVE